MKIVQHLECMVFHPQNQLKFGIVKHQRVWYMVDKYSFWDYSYENNKNLFKEIYSDENSGDYTNEEN